MICSHFTLWGNPTTYLGATLTWEGRTLTSYEDETNIIEYEYDENGMRYRTTVTSKTDGLTGSYEYVWVDGKLISIVYVSGDSTETAKYLYNDRDEPVGMVLTDADGTLSTYYYLKNMQGDITHIVSASGKLLVEFTYDVFGKQTVHYQANGSTIIGMIELVEQVMARALTPFGYRGYCYDSYTDLYYLQSRYYDPETGRFINADDTNYLNATGTVLSCNLFAYCENDPEKAAQYAIDWANLINPTYVFISEGDCANFVSQCLLEGGINTTSTWYPSYYKLVNSYKYVKMGGRTIRVNSPQLQYVYAYAWNFAKGLYIYFAQTKYCDGSAWFNIYSKKSKDITNIVASMAKFVEKGDILFYSSSYKYTGIYHAVIVTEVTKSDVKISAHSHRRCNKSLRKLLSTDGIKSVWALSIRRDAR